jgi:dihydroneopterin aldolase
MLSISLQEMRFHASHGIYTEEAVTGGMFMVNVSVEADDEPPPARLSDTIDYEKLYDIIRQEMSGQTDMLETLAYRCVYHIRKIFPQAKTVEIKISKLHPPMGGETGRSVVTLRKTF